MLGKRLTGQARLQPFGIAENALKDVAFAWVDQLIENDLVNLGDGVGPVGMDAEAQHVADDQQRRITEGTRILLKLGERRAQVAVGLFVLPGEMLFLPDIRPTGGSGRFDGPFSKAYHVPVGSASLGMGSSRRWQRSMNWLCAA